MNLKSRGKLVALNASWERKNRELLLDLFEYNPKASFLDVGCNRGSFTLKAAEKIGTNKIFAIEINKENVKLAMKKGIKVVEADLNNKLPFKNNSFDIILANQVIEHLYFTDDFIKEIKRILKPNGYLIISSTNLAALHYRIMLLVGMQPVCLHPSVIHFGNFLRGTITCGSKWGHKSIFTYWALKEFLQHHRFKIIKKFSYGIYPLPDFISRLILKIFPNFGVWSTFKVKK